MGKKSCDVTFLRCAGPAHKLGNPSAGAFNLGRACGVSLIVWAIAESRKMAAEINQYLQA
jgi:hypothetical protein